jgi:carbon storage regulator
MESLLHNRASIAIIDSKQEDTPMLVLSRKVGERILIGDNISVTVVRIAPGIVRIGIDAPAQLPVMREELKENAPGAVEKAALVSSG